MTPFLPKPEMFLFVVKEGKRECYHHVSAAIYVYIYIYTHEFYMLRTTTGIQLNFQEEGLHSFAAMC